MAFDDPPFRAIILSGLRDSWVSDLLIDDTTEGIDAAGDASRITIENVVFRHTTTITSPAKPSDFLVRGTQILILRCGSSGNDLFYVMTGARNQGPNVAIISSFTETATWSRINAGPPVFLSTTPVSPRAASS